MSVLAKVSKSSLMALLLIAAPAATGAMANEPKLAGWAAVRADGTLLRAKGVSKVTPGSTGTYTIKFDRNVRKCAYFAQIANPEEATFVLGLTTAMYPDIGKKKRVKLAIFDSNSSVGFNHGFFVQALC